MRVFVTGASGFIGSAVVQELLANGHRVVGLARSDAAEASLKALGAEVLRGSLEDLDSLKRGAAGADGVLHLAFIHDFANCAASAVKDRAAIEAMGAALEGTNKPLVVTSGTLIGRFKTEDEKRDSNMGPRFSEAAALPFASRGVRVSVIRLPPTVHGNGDHAFVPRIIDLARQKGSAAYIGEGANRWPAVHRVDAAKLYRLALEKGTAGAIYHGIAEEGIPIREMANVIGKRLNLPVVSKAAGKEADDYFGWLAMFLSIDGPSSSKITQEQLGWRATEPGLIADMEASYFQQ